MSYLDELAMVHTDLLEAEIKLYIRNNHTYIQLDCNALFRKMVGGAIRASGRVLTVVETAIRTDERCENPVLFVLELGLSDRSNSTSIDGIFDSISNYLVYHFVVRHTQMSKSNYEIITMADFYTSAQSILPYHNTIPCYKTVGGTII